MTDQPAPEAWRTDPRERLLAARYAWCFSHGVMHRFTGQPWCTATWVAFTETTEPAAHAAKQYAYGDARFLDELSIEKQLEVIKIEEART